jgi:cobalamin biosynthesis protein CbiG
LKVPSHIRAAKGAVAVVEDHGSYVIVEKLGHAGEVAEALAEGSRS